MFERLKRGDLVLRPDVIHGQRNDHKPVVYYIKDSISNVSQGVIVVNGRRYCTKTGTSLDACSTLPLCVFIHTHDQTVERNKYLQLIDDRHKLRDVLSSDDTIDCLNRSQICQIQFILKSAMQNNRR